MSSEVEEEKKLNMTCGHATLSNKFAKMAGVVIEETSDDREYTKVEQIPEPEEMVTTREAWRQPWIKILLVSSLVLVITIFLYGMVNEGIQAVNESDEPTKPNLNSQTDNKEKYDVKDETGELKTKVALTTQKRELKTLNIEKPKVEATPTPQPTPQPTLKATPPKPKVVYVTRSRRPTPQSYKPPAPPPPPRVISKPSIIPTPENKDPMEEWLAVSNMGVYGSSGDIAQIQETQVEGIEGGSGEIVSDNGISEQNNNLGTDYTRKRVLVGSYTDGQLKTPIMWGGNIPPQENQSYLIQLSKPLKGFDNSEVLPKGSYIVAKVINSNSSGFIQMEATSYLINNNEINNEMTQEKQIPGDSILILGKHGKPLKAKSHKGRDIGNIVLASVLGGVKKVAEIENQGDSVTSINSTGFSSSVTSNGNKNLAAGFAEGSLKEILGRVARSQEESLQRVKSEPEVFVIKSGSDVKLFINKSISL